MPDNLPPPPGDVRNRPAAATAEQNPPAAQAEPVRHHPLRTLLIIVGVCVVLVVAALWLFRYITVGQYFVGTDDAYVSADSSLAATKISGYVTAVPVQDNQLVAKGQLLAQIDPRDYQNALTIAAADAQAAQAAILSDRAQLALQQANIAGAAAAVTGDQARLAFAARDQRRYQSLAGSGASTQQDTEQAGTGVQTAEAALAGARATLLTTQRQVDVLNAALLQAQASLTQAEARQQQAALDLSHTDITAPFDGMVGDKTVQIGDYVQTGTELMAIVPLAQVYVIANYKETQITHLLPGQKVRIDVDGFPALKVRGTVASVAPASGQEFALLPPDNATGNFTKIVQRVPVKIWIDLNNNLIGRLRPGMSVEPEIDTRTPNG